MLIKKLEDLMIYQIAVKLRNEVYEEVQRIPFCWKNDDVRQVKRLSSSVASNIAEGFGR
jgi:four helix bundle protein